jgi:uncharacterized RDD family membrane protein YckC
VDGALAPKPAPLRELPGTRKKEKTWRDEVNERVQSRRKRRADEGALPLFDPPPPLAPPPEPPGEAVVSAVPARPKHLAEPAGQAEPHLEDEVIAESAEEAVGDLPLRHSADRALTERDPALEQDEPAGGAEAPRAAVDDEEWRLELEPPVPESRPVERPAHFGERARAGAVDLALVSLMSLVVVYFTSRAARVPIAGLLPAWPWLVGYLAFLGLAYATYFTGTTGQTLGKMLFDLRVVDTFGQPPGYLRSFLRAALGAVSCLAAGLGVLPMAFDPARRGLHDRALRTRVVRG